MYVYRQCAKKYNNLQRFDAYVIKCIIFDHLQGAVLKYTIKKSFIYSPGINTNQGATAGKYYGPIFLFTSSLLEFCSLIFRNNRNYGSALPYAHIRFIKQLLDCLF